jgi:heat shock protein HspQ
VGDIVKSKNCPTIDGFVIVRVKEDSYSVNLKNYCIKFKDQDNYELINKPKFKVDDRIRHRLTGDVYKVLFVLSDGSLMVNEIGKRIDVKEQDNYELINKPKFKIGDRIKHKILNFTHRIMDIKDEYYIINETSLPHGLLPIKSQDHYELVPDKFVITTLKPFTEILVRLTNNCVWIPKFFSHYNTDPKMKCYPFITTDNIGYVQCIPYKGNEHLCRTTNDCDNFYKIWE